MIMMIQVFNQEDKESLILKGLKFICEQNMGNCVAYVFEYNKKMNFDISDIKKYKVTNKLYF